MAFCPSQHLFLVRSPQNINPSLKSQSLIINSPICCVRLRTQLKSLPPKSSDSSLQERNPTSTTKLDDRPSPDPPDKSSLLDWISNRLLLLKSDGVVKSDGLLPEILSIALPAALALASDPIMSLVDTAFVGHIGSVELAAVGVSVTVFNLISKLFNVPLLNITTSFVAEEQALVYKSDENSNKNDLQDVSQSKQYLPSVATSLALAASIGIVEAVTLSIGSGFFMNIMGIPADSPMRVPAQHFLTLRAFGAPPIVIALAAQGSFRGFMDTKTPLYAISAGNVLNAILDPILIFVYGLGIGGAAIATVISEYLCAFILLWKLSGKISLIPSKVDGRKIARYLKSGGLLTARTLAVFITMTLATSMAARDGPIQMAGHQICVQVWLAVSLLTDALALAGQSLIANNYSQGNYEQSQRVTYEVLKIGTMAGTGLAVILFFFFGAFSSLFTSDSQVLGITQSGLLFVAGSQPVNAIAFVLDGLYYGVSDFGYAAYSTILAGLISSIFILLAAPAFGLPGVWTGLFLFMTLRVVAGIWRLGTRSGPWKMVWVKLEEESK